MADYFIFVLVIELDMCYVRKWSFTVCACLISDTELTGSRGCPDAETYEICQEYRGLILSRPLLLENGQPHESWVYFSCRHIGLNQEDSLPKSKVKMNDSERCQFDIFYMK